MYVKLLADPMDGFLGEIVLKSLNAKQMGFYDWQKMEYCDTHGTLLKIL